jgi:hypothetical protein
MAKRVSVMCLCTALSILVLVGLATAQTANAPLEYRVLATNKTSTMEKELNAAAEAGFQFSAVMGGDTAFGGNEVVVVMSRRSEARGRFAYRLLATSKTSTMERELQQAADAGYHYRGQTIFGTNFSGDEVVVILERDEEAALQPFEYHLVATAKTSTLQEELSDASMGGYEMVGMTVARTAFGGSELVAITRRPKR